MKHFLQSKEWMEVKKNLGNKVVEVDGVFMQLTPIPVIGKNVGYIPRADLKDVNWVRVTEEAKKLNCVYVTVDPLNNFEDGVQLPNNFKFDSGLPIHLQDNILIDLSKSDEQLLEEMKQKHRYNLRLAEKKGVEVRISDTQEGFEEFLKLYLYTVQRQGYSGRDEKYVRTTWETIKGLQAPNLVIKIATAYFENKPIASWMLFLYEDVVYYPYGGSNEEFRNLMPTYKLLWDVVKFGKANGFKYLDLFGIKADESDGYSRFKVGFGGERVKYADTMNLIVDSSLYNIVLLLQKLRNKILFRN